MKIISWNVNGIRAVMKKGFMDFFTTQDADIFCLQETKIHDGDIPSDLQQLGALQGFKGYWYGAEKKGYSGVATFTKITPLSVKKGIGDKRFDDEGRVLTLEFNDFYLINTYVPNSKRGLLRLEERQEFNTLFLDYCEQMRKEKPIIICGDLNVAHKEIDLANPQSNKRNAGFTDEERNDLTTHLDKGYYDTFRMFNKEPNNYTWWSYMFNSREKNVGWRIDYFLVSEELKDNIKSSEILSEICGSDHCPIKLDINAD